MSFGCLWLLTTNGAESLIWERKSDVNMWPGGNGSTYVLGVANSDSMNLEEVYRGLDVTVPSPATTELKHQSGNVCIQSILSQNFEIASFHQSLYHMQATILTVISA
ncbi:hypothetical protein ABEW05_011337 [Botrytis cinerea]